MFDSFSEIGPLIEVTKLSWQWKAFLFYAFIFIFFAGITTIQMLVGCFAVLTRFRQIGSDDVFRLLRSNSLPPITFIIPAYNEEEVISHTVRNLLSLSYRYKKIIIVNDGSTDSTLDILKSQFHLKRIPPSYPGKLPTKKIRNYFVSTTYPDLYVIDKDNGSKADALNAGLNICTTEIFVAADSDTLVDDNALNRLIHPFLSNPKTVVAHASIGLLNGCKIKQNRIEEYIFPKKLITGLQAIDYMKSFLVERMGLTWTKGALVVPGNFGLFKYDEIVELGGYDVKSLVEDTEIITHLHEKMLSENREYEITYVPDIVAWTAGPETVQGLIRQRVRWYRGTTENTWQYRHMCFNPKYRSIGMFVFPMTVFEKIAPLIEISGFVILLIAAFTSNVDLLIVLTLAVAGWLYVSFLSVFTVFMDVIVYETYSSKRDFARIFKCTLSYVVYHYILLYCRIKGLYVPKAKKPGWTPERTSYESVEKS